MCKKTRKSHFRDSRNQDSPACLLWGRGTHLHHQLGCRLSRSATGMGEEGPLFLARSHRQIWSAHDHSHTLTCSDKATPP